MIIWYRHFIKKKKKNAKGFIFNMNEIFVVLLWLYKLCFLIVACCWHWRCSSWINQSGMFWNSSARWNVCFWVNKQKSWSDSSFTWRLVLLFFFLWYFLNSILLSVIKIYLLNIYRIIFRYIFRGRFCNWHLQLIVHFSLFFSTVL